MYKYIMSRGASWANFSIDVEAGIPRKYNVTFSVSKNDGYGTMLDKYDVININPNYDVVNLINDIMSFDHVSSNMPVLNLKSQTTGEMYRLVIIKHYGDGRMFEFEIVTEDGKNWIKSDWFTYGKWREES